MILQAYDGRNDVERMLAGLKARLEFFDFTGNDGFGALGLFVPVGDAESLRKVIVDLWASPEESARMGIEGRRTVLEHRQQDRFVRQVGDVIAAAAASGG